MNRLITPYSHTSLPVLQKLVATYKIWQIYRRNFHKDLRYSLGAKIDHLFIETVELIFIASQSSLEKKLPYIQRASLKLDTLKFFLQIAWESDAIDNKKYIELSEYLEEIGKQIGGWQKDTLRKLNPA